MPPSPADLDVLGGRLTSTGVAVVKVGPRHGEASVVVKLAITSAAAALLARETAVLSTLRAEPRLGGWSRLVPRPYASGSQESVPYRIDAVLPGAPGPRRLEDSAARGALLDAAADAIAILHRRTAAVVTIDAALLDRWVDAHIRELTGHRSRRDSLARRLERVRSELYEVLRGRRVSAGWIHGDYWLGNLLVSSRQMGPYQVDGIVDWETAATTELPLHDLLHLVLYTRRLQTGQELGGVVCDQLRRPTWPAEEHLVLERHPAVSHADQLGERHALMLYWLRHLAVHMRQQSSSLSWRTRWWRHRNVFPVLGLLWR